VCDVGQPGAIETFRDATRAGRIDILVNNATGYGFNDRPRPGGSALTST
jgi:NAD(P)-dependent dehydrogenase (short-subunit alcohol dehydrogenase family)